LLSAKKTIREQFCYPAKVLVRNLGRALAMVRRLHKTLRPEAEARTPWTVLHIHLKNITNTVEVFFLENASLFLYQSAKVQPGLIIATTILTTTLDTIIVIFIY